MNPFATPVVIITNKSKTMKYKLPELQFAEDALAPVISAKTISFHYGKHTKTYFDNLIK